MTYTYMCAAGAEFDVQRSITAPPLTDCPVCGKCTPKRLIAAAAPAHLKAGPSGGWSASGYSTTDAAKNFERRMGRKPSPRVD